MFRGATLQHALLDVTGVPVQVLPAPHAPQPNPTRLTSLSLFPPFKKIDLCALFYFGFLFLGVKTYSLSLSSVKEAFVGPTPVLWAKLCKYIGFPVTCVAKNRSEMPEEFVDRVCPGAVYCILDVEELNMGEGRAVLLGNVLSVAGLPSTPSDDRSPSEMLVLSMHDWLACFEDFSVCYLAPSPRKVNDICYYIYYYIYVYVNIQCMQPAGPSEEYLVRVPVPVAVSV